MFVVNIAKHIYGWLLSYLFQSQSQAHSDAPAVVEMAVGIEIGDKEHDNESENPIVRHSDEVTGDGIRLTELYKLPVHEGGVESK